MLACWRASSASAGAAGLALEDSCFPKMNSFVGDRHPLADIDEFSGRLRAVKDAVADDLILVARIEALIAGMEWTTLFCALTLTPTQELTGYSFTRERVHRTRYFRSSTPGRTVADRDRSNQILSNTGLSVS